MLSKLDDPQTEIDGLLIEGQNEIRDLNAYAQKLGTYLDYPYVEQMLNDAAEVSNQQLSKLNMLIINDLVPMYQKVQQQIKQLDFVKPPQVKLAPESGN